MSRSPNFSCFHFYSPIVWYLWEQFKVFFGRMPLRLVVKIPEHLFNGSGFTVASVAGMVVGLFLGNGNVLLHRFSSKPYLKCLVLEIPVWAFLVILVILCALQFHCFLMHVSKHLFRIVKFLKVA